jgi:hypothetical protein
MKGSASIPYLADALILMMKRHEPLQILRGAALAVPIITLVPKIKMIYNVGSAQMRKPTG